MERMTSHFSWITFYQELAKELATWQDRQGELISFLEGLRAQQFVITPLTDKDSEGARFLLKEIDPFTFFGVFNRGLRQENRLAILSSIKKHFNLKSALPDDFDGIPILNNQKSWFFPYQYARDAGDIGKLWNVFQQALGNEPLKSKEFIQAFDAALTVKQTNINLTMGLFWIRSETFLSLDLTNRAFFDIKLPPGGLTAEFYLEILRSFSSKGKSYPELSYDAFLGSKKAALYTEETNSSESSTPEGTDYWMVGAYWDDRDPADQTERFLEEGIWENGYDNRYIDEVKSMNVGDRIAIKAATTQRKDLPFDNRNKTISRMIIKAIGTIVANRNDGRTIEVEWEPDFKEKSWYFYTNRGTVWHVRPVGKNVWKEAADQLINFVWYGQEQNYDWFIKAWWDKKPSEPGDDEKISIGVENPYSVQDILASGVFLEEEEINQIIERLRDKKAIIIQGTPGVGKTFIARKLAYALMNEIDPERLMFVQFHQSYSYDDFVRGYRPLPGQAGAFGIQNGVFYTFCQKAINDPDLEYVFIIDEINRGNLSQIFGELLMLIEGDKRGLEFAVPLVYRIQEEERFYIPSNLYLIGLMNVADRSLAMVDYALRRRFAFITLKPQYESEIFRRWLDERGMASQLVQLIIERMSMLNKAIREDPLLGENYQIGHSYFCPKGDDFAALDQKWYRDIVRTEIMPLLKEYWFDNPKKAEEAERGLLA
jgi:5-methylcytosine-specific restriction enzyme B